MPPMPPMSSLDQLIERVELLLARHAQLQRSNALLAGQVAALSQERDSLQSRLRAARARVEALVERLPDPASAALSSSSPVPPKDHP